MATSGKRIKSKMKKCDPESFSIHDFLGECKSADAADSRFEETDTSLKQEYYFVNQVSASDKLSHLYGEVCSILADYGMKQKKDDTGRFHLVLGGKNGNGIPFKRFSQLFKWDYGIIPHCNYFRGFVWLNKKEKMIQILRQYSNETGWDIDAHLPESYLFFPDSAEDSELDGFRIAYEGSSKRSNSNAWILKPSETCRGEKITIKEDYDDIMSFINSKERGVPYVIQRYISNPLLLSGNRKFDLRFFVLVNHKMEAYFYPEGVCRSCSSEYSMEDLCDQFAHLSSKKIQHSHKHFGKYESQNEMSTEQFSKWYSSECGGSFDQNILPKVKDVIARTIAASKDKLENVSHADYTGFQLFAFDFLLDEESNIWFHEVCGTPDIPKQFATEMANDIVEIAIKPLFADLMGEASYDNIKHFEPLEEDVLVSCNGNKK